MPTAETFPSFSLAGQSALVTGAARGLGRSIALALAHAGADVALGLRDVASGDELVADIEALGRQALPLQMDVTRRDEVDAAVAATVERFGRIDVLVNNAGGGRMGAALEVTEEDFDHIVDLNLRSTFFVSQAVAPQMIHQGSGRIVNMSSQAAFVALPRESVYCMAKAGVSHLTKCLAVEWGPRGIAVNAVAPTFVATPGTEPALADPVFRDQVLANIAALHRIGEPVEVAGAVVFLASPAASLITGETLLIDGGWTAR